jgi:hypothetical protein
VKYQIGKFPKSVLCLTTRQIFKLFANTITESPYRDPKRTNWSSYGIRVNRRLSQNDLKIDNIDKLNNVTDFFSISLLKSYEESCPLIAHKNKKHTPGWNTGLEKMKKNLNKAFNKRHQDLEFYREMRKAYKKATRQSFRNAWNSFCESTND